MSVEDLEMILSYPPRLKRFTLRGPYYLDARDFENDGYMAFADTLNLYHQDSLESLDLDIYWGTRAGFQITDMPYLKEVTVTPYSLMGIDPEANIEIENALPESLEKLTLRYEEGTTLPLSSLCESLRDGAFTKLRTVICQIPDNIQESPTSSEVRIETEAWKAKFKVLEVDLSAPLVPYPTTTPKYDVCSCENLSFYHRFPFHPRAKPFRPEQLPPPTRNVPPVPRPPSYYDGVSDDYDPYEDDPPYLYDMTPSPPSRTPHFDDYDDYLDWASGY